MSPFHIGGTNSLFLQGSSRKYPTQSQPIHPSKSSTPFTYCGMKKTPPLYSRFSFCGFLSRSVHQQPLKGVSLRTTFYIKATSRLQLIFQLSPIYSIYISDICKAVSYYRANVSVDIHDVRFALITDPGNLFFVAL